MHRFTLTLFAPADKTFASHVAGMTGRVVVVAAAVGGSAAGDGGGGAGVLGGGAGVGVTAGGLVAGGFDACPLGVVRGVVERVSPVEGSVGPTMTGSG